MRNIRLLNGMLWVLNGLLGAGIVVFTFQKFIFSQEADYLRGFDPAQSGGAARPERPAPQASDDILKKLRNPLEKGGGIQRGTESGPPKFKATLYGVMAGDDPRKGVAFLRLAARNLEFVAFPDEPISYDGKPVEELAGWKLVEVHREKATFTNGKETQVVPLDTESSRPGAAGRTPGPVPGTGRGGPSVNRAGQAYQAEGYGTRLITSDDRQQVWQVDPQEMEWAAQNQDRIIDQDIQVSPIPGGGLKVESVQAGSIGAARGVLAGDVVKNVNGIPLNSLADLKNLSRNPALRNQSVLRLTVERAGRTMVLTYQPLRQ